MRMISGRSVSALAGSDYYATNGTLTFTNGVTSQSITLRLINDDLQETNKTLQLRLSSVTDGIITNDPAALRPLFARP